MNLSTEGKWGGYDSPSNQVRIISFYILSGAFISGITWLGFSKIINLLDKILKKNKRIKVNNRKILNWELSCLIDIVLL